jgi:asparaginyl-tRNA synthetase
VETQADTPTSAGAAPTGEAAGGAAEAALTTIERIGEHDGRRVRLQGWLHNRRSKGKLHFLIVRDGTGFVQGVAFKKALTEETFELMGSLAHEAAIRVEGTVKADARAPGGYELSLDHCELVHEPTGEFPIGRKEHGPDFLLSNRHLWLRSEKQWAVMRVRHEVEKAIHDFFYDRGFTRMDAPILTPAACEGTSTLFELEYFDQGSAYLTQSGQLYAEAGAMALGKVYTFGPTFRAEKSKTRRHLTEFWMVEPEMAYADLDDVMDLAEEFICYIVGRVLERRRRELETLGRDVTKLEAVTPPFPRISYDEAVRLLNDNGNDFVWGGDLGAPDETLISGLYDKPVMIHRYPKEVKAFYMKRDPQDDRVAKCVDVIAPEGVGEIIGGSEREDDLAALEQRIEEHGLPEEAFQWYLDLRRFGSVPHGGFGLGIERTVAWLCGREHVRECIPFPRMLYRIYP